MLRGLEGFHVWAARQMTGMMPTKDTARDWTYPALEKVLKTTGLYTINEYIEVCRNTILKFVSQRPIYELCRGAERQHGTSKRQYWWEQSIDLEGTSPATATGDSFGVFAGA
mmetsp:Transcript_16214/g.26241  ORF Transcript_16214/g.26241 Transcript_16214/m.26241 type:complete len:112 (-) Transcript_16214:185-520(-)|eukprot:CAMPEP_0196170360 /NCGR_PEP_ID=MMETSP0911-20130528/4683_1 /TAXON_ID=49265 /ORGANISM="Thalassiosira rotula, Strain GSO102" /LENGTH=111 /DNA_ID=CAMNT_0041436901 /DNA_START=269 /DNA_END=604 /DNA_ORIENTATION=+